VFPPDVHAAYVEALRAPGHAHAVCEEYRAAATIDRQHDRADLASGHRIACPILALWSAPGPLGTWYAQEGGPIAIWQAWGDDVRGGTLEAGHYFPEEAPEQTADALDLFFGGAQ
jgi:haloacetate dehalogenase